MYVKFTLNHGKTADLQDSHEFKKIVLTKSLKYCPESKSDSCFGQKRQETPRKSEKHILLVIQD